MTLTGEMFISKGKGSGFYTTLKGQEDKRFFLNINFRKGAEPEDGGKIQINEGFLACYTTKNGDIKPKFVVMDYVMADEARPAKKSVTPAKKQYIEVEDGELPF